MVVETQYFASPAIQSGFSILICMRETQNIASLHLKKNLLLNKLTFLNSVLNRCYL